SGDFDASKVEAMIRKRRAAFQRCYEKELQKNPTLSGKVTVTFTIQESGSVTGARATNNTSNNSALAACVVGTFRRFRFNPGPSGGSVTYSYPIVFAPQQ
ncbi:MAG: TonB family protein, partial [Polyangiales bacterium]